MTAEPRRQEPEPKTLTPYSVIHRGQDAVDAEGNVTFTDFSPAVLPADVELPGDRVPKGSSVPGYADTSESKKNPEQTDSENLAPKIVARGSTAVTPENPSPPSF